MKILNSWEGSFEKNLKFDENNSLSFDLNGYRFRNPFGLADGFDKNCEIIKHLSYFGFGYSGVGTITDKPREGNPKPRLVDNEKHALYNALGFNSYGVEYCRDKLDEYIRIPKEYRIPIFVSYSGIPVNGNIDLAMDENRKIVDTLNPYCEGFTYNPSSPNTYELKILRNPEILQMAVQDLKDRAKGKLKFVKFPPYENDNEKEEILKQIKACHDYIDGIVLVNARKVDKKVFEKKARDFGFPTAGESGKPLKPYALKAIKNFHDLFPDLLIRGVGGIYSSRDAYEFLKSGATLVEFYTVLTFKGFGFVGELKRDLPKLLKKMVSTLTKNF